jgi:hypothetical protein
MFEIWIGDNHWKIGNPGERIGQFSSREEAEDYMFMYVDCLCDNEMFFLVEDNRILYPRKEWYTRFEPSNFS